MYHPPPTPAPSIAHGLVMSEPILVTIMLTSLVYLSQLYVTTLRQPNIYSRPIFGRKRARDVETKIVGLPGCGHWVVERPRC